MGVILPKPIISKVVDRIGNNQVAASCCSINGFRNSMEDAHTMKIYDDRMLFGVFDGHSNDKCSAYVAEHLPSRITSQPLPIANATLENICVDLDRMFLDDVGDGGSTGVFTIIEPPKAAGQPYKATICNVGDSRILIERNGELVFETKDHKPMNPGERKRIEDNGGTVRMNRVDGDLAVSRAFGDGVFKKDKTGRFGDLRTTKVIAVPDIDRVECYPGDVMIIACDGVFEGNFSNEEVARFTHEQVDATLKSHGDIAVVAARVCDQAVRRGSKDNISCMVILFGNGEALARQHQPTSFVPGPPYPKTHDASRQAYMRMAQIANVDLATALETRYRLLDAFVSGRLDTFPPIMRVAFEMSDDVDVESEKNFFGQVPQDNGDLKAFFQTLAEGR